MEVVHLKHGAPDYIKGCAIAIGNFDGIHKGHREIISQLKSYASKQNIPTAILTFEPHPIALFNPEAKNYRITPEPSKIRILEKTDIDYLLIAEFNNSFAKISAHDFIENILHQQLEVKAVFTGKDFIFGHNRSGNSPLLEVKSEEFNFYYTAISNVNDNSEIRYSSSRVRELLHNGEVETANKMLGYNFAISGEVLKGRQDGRKLGFPTANLSIEGFATPKFGVYSGIVTLENGERYIAAVNIGISPTFNETSVFLEAHILDFNSDIYGKTIHVELLNYIREEEKFDNLDELKKQIKKDIKIIKNES